MNTYKRLEHLLYAGAGQLTVLICIVLVFGGCKQLNKPNTTVQITFKSAEKTLYTIEAVNTGSIINLPDTLKKDSSLDGWYTDEGCTKKWDFAAAKVSKDTVLYAKQTQTGNIKVTFMNEGEVLYTTWAKYYKTLPEEELFYVGNMPNDDDWGW